MNILKVSFNKKHHGYYLTVGNKISIGAGQWKGLNFSTYGLGLSKRECQWRDCKRFNISHIVNIYFGRHFLTYSKKGYRDHFENCRIDWEMELISFLKFKFKNWVRYDGKRIFDKVAETFLKKFVFTKEYNFTIERSFSRPVKIKTDKLTAFQLAVNYEADLWHGGRLVLSPLGLDWEENNESISKILGKPFKFNRLFGYADFADVEIIK